MLFIEIKSRKYGKDGEMIRRSANSKTQAHNYICSVLQKMTNISCATFGIMFNALVDKYTKGVDYPNTPANGLTVMRYENSGFILSNNEIYISMRVEDDRLSVYLNSSNADDSKNPEFTFDARIYQSKDLYPELNDEDFSNKPIFGNTITIEEEE